MHFQFYSPQRLCQRNIEHRLIEHDLYMHKSIGRETVGEEEREGVGRQRPRERGGEMGKFRGTRGIVKLRECVEVVYRETG